MGWDGMNCLYQLYYRRSYGWMGIISGVGIRMAMNFACCTLILFEGGEALVYSKCGMDEIRTQWNSEVGELIE